MRRNVVDDRHGSKDFTEQIVLAAVFAQQI